MAEVGVARAAPDYQRVVGHSDRRQRALDRLGPYEPGLEIEARDLGHQHADVPAALEDRPQRIGDLARRESPGGDLVGQRLKEMEVAAVDQRDVDRCTAEV